MADLGPGQSPFASSPVFLPLYHTPSQEDESWTLARVQLLSLSEERGRGEEGEGGQETFEVKVMNGVRLILGWH